MSVATRVTGPAYVRGTGTSDPRRSGCPSPDADARFAAVDSVASSVGATGNQVVLAWMLAQQAPRVLPLIGARTWDQYLECVDALDVTLTPEQLAELDAAGAIT